MCSDAFKPTPVVEDGEEVVGLFKIQSQKVNKVRTITCRLSCLVCVCVSGLVFPSVAEIEGCR
jgi:hypothetical protein